MTASDAVSGDCQGGCGTVVKRRRNTYPEMSDERWDWLADMDLWCDACVERTDREERETTEAEARLKRFEKRKLTAGIPLLMQGVTWDKVEVDERNAEAVDAARRWAIGELRTLVLIGEFGVGKSFIAAAAAWQRMEGEALKWYSVPGLIAQSLGGWDSDERRDASSALLGKTALVLDDMDKVKATDWVASQLFVAIDGRVQNGGGLLVTTNLEPNELAAAFGDAIADRLFGLGEAHVVSGRSRRGKA